MDLSPAFLDAVQRVWERGDAVTPLDRRLPAPAMAGLLRALGPARVLDADGEHPSGVRSLPVEEGDALVMATSGSTGAPKGVVLTHEALQASAVATSRRLGVDPHSDTWLACLPVAHIGGFSVLVRSMVTGTGLVMHERFEAARVEAAGADGATLVALVGTALGRVDASVFRKVLLGGAAPPEELPENVVSTYGMTETGSGVVYDGQPLDGVEVAIGDGSLGAAGEILLRGPMLMRAYRDGTDPRLEGGWFPTGDAGSIEGSLGRGGLLQVRGRMAEVIVTGGEKVWPGGVESLLVRHPSIAEAAVAGRADPEWGERVVAFVVPAAGHQPPTLDEVRDLVKSELSPWAAPRELVIMESLPRTAGGKLLRRALET